MQPQLIAQQCPQQRREYDQDGRAGQGRGARDGAGARAAVHSSGDGDAEESHLHTGGEAENGPGAATGGHGRADEEAVHDAVHHDRLHIEKEGMKSSRTREGIATSSYDDEAGGDCGAHFRERRAPLLAAATPFEGVSFHSGVETSNLCCVRGV